MTHTGFQEGKERTLNNFYAARRARRGVKFRRAPVPRNVVERIVHETRSICCDDGGAQPAGRSAGSTNNGIIVAVVRHVYAYPWAPRHVPSSRVVVVIGRVFAPRCDLTSSNCAILSARTRISLAHRAAAQRLVHAG